jgi:hypothetical protein
VRRAARASGPRPPGPVVAVATSLLLLLALAAGPALGQGGGGVGGASWTPDRSRTTAVVSDLLVPGDSVTFVTRMSWSRQAVRGLARYVADGLRYTQEVNDRSGRLSATGYWASSLPDPAFDRDDDDGDGRWEEAEVTAGSQLPVAGRRYTTMMQFSRWRPVARRARCAWGWDRRAARMEVFSQLSRQLLGEWQAMRYTLAYERLEVPRAGLRPDLPDATPRPDCGPAGSASPSTEPLVVTFVRPLEWPELLDVADAAEAWSAFEAIGSHPDDRLPWTCGGPVRGRSGLEACAAMGVRADGVTAAGGHFEADAARRLRRDPRVARVTDWRDPLTTWLATLAGVPVEPPDLTLDDDWWALNRPG